ncbi:Acid trehalase [Penicillium taxi]|uniref:Acid trehalase n=1 Tax=Penicillium taxi TaxID=168475 RepID=UPI0025453DE9|nr:Acid trehalase [Penicillium taxi]KAJ5885375.1 Acid trehalase [Penicillium taxi]
MQLKIFAWAAFSLLGYFTSLGEAHHTRRSNAYQTRITEGLKQHMGLNHKANISSSNVYQTNFDGVTWDEENWQLATTNLQQGQFQSRGSVANGYLGINVASVGPFFEVDSAKDGDNGISGWPLFTTRQSFATISGFFDSQPTTNKTNFEWLYQYGSDSVISGVPHWSGLILDLGNDTYLDATVDNTTISNFTSVYDYKSGVLYWSLSWKPSGNTSFEIEYRLFVNKLYINQAVVDMHVISSADTNASIVNVIDGGSAVRTSFVRSGEDNGAIFSAVRPNGVANVTAYIYANMSASEDISSRQIVNDKPYLSAVNSSIAQSASVKLKAGKIFHATKFIGAASSDAFADPMEVAKNASISSSKNGYAWSLLAHLKEWASVMPDDSVDHYSFENGTLPSDINIIDSSIIAVVNTYYLLQNTVGNNAINASSGTAINVDSISVGGLTSDSYAGQVFWDADLWMQPGLTASHPEAAQRITNYRLKNYGRAKENIQTAFVGSQNQTRFSESAAIFPWTSGRYGNCTATGPCWDYEYHINGDIAMAIINQWVTSGDTEFFKETFFPVYDSIATLYADMLNPNGSSWTLTNMTDPDEYANHIDAGGFTMPLIAQTLMYANALRQQFGLEENSTWNEMASNVLVLRENGVTLEFTTMNGSAVVKQADVVLNTYPLDYSASYSAQDSLNDLEYYANKQSTDGPAMTWAIFSIVANEISPSGCSAYTYGQYAYKPYTRAPFYQMSEQLIDNSTTNGGTHPAFPFLTGHGGSNQVVLFGYLGLRLLPDDILHVEPNLPPQIPYLKYRTFYWRGWPISAWSNHTHTTISRASTAPLATADQRFENSSITINSGFELNSTTYHLPLNGFVSIPNRQIGSQNTVSGNLVQCQSIESPNSYQPGQFPIAANDGAASTKWQPSSAANWSSLTVELGAGAIVSGFYFDWAQEPPVNATVIFHNETLDNPVQTYITSDGASVLKVATELNNIILSNPYNATNVDVIAIPAGNTTNVTLSKPIPAARFASLLIVGNQALDAVDVQFQNGTGATVAEWAILGLTDEESSDISSEKRRMNVRAAKTLDAASGSFMRRRRQFLPKY